jgi:hypothetical protein
MVYLKGGWRETRGIEWFIEDQASSPPHPLSKLSLFLSLSVCRQSCLLKAEGEGGGGGGKSNGGVKT